MTAPDVEVSVDRFVTACIEVLNKPGGGPNSPVKLKDLGKIVTALGDFVTSVGATLADIAASRRADAEEIQRLAAIIEAN